MNVELVATEALSKATALVDQGTGESLKAAISLLLHSKARRTDESLLARRAPTRRSCPPRAAARREPRRRSHPSPPAQAEREDAATDDGMGVNAAPVLNSALKKLHDDAYLCLEVEAGCEANAIKKAYRKIALQYHPDKNKNRTGLLFTTARSRDAREPARRRVRGRV